ncbi:helix-turn-helix domain-containing protein [Cohnella sp. CFH 77786]|uniref:response regulator transcription factor n=1 Tax=Cohnella sp. CFH 77786 TaxID=2662265 RepID=UPI001C61021B|nr:helix-turn-helix domain-containing protein [Cohnella sp. CFH 77786]
MKIVIADDERLSRVNLVQMIGKMSQPWELAGEAANGEELVELVREQMPDIAIVDIRMPKMNGLTAIQTAREVSPLTQWIILSGFSDFEYARQAIQLGASEYLLKPVRSEQLEQTLNRVFKDNVRYKLLLNKQFENDLTALYHGLACIDQEPDGSMMRNGNFSALLFYIDGSCTGAEMMRRQSEFSRDVRTQLDDLTRNGFCTALVALSGGELAAVAASETERSGRTAAMLRTKLEKLLGQYGSSSLKITALQTAECDSFPSLFEQTELLREKACLRPVLGIGRLWTMEEMDHSANNAAWTEIGKHLIELAAAYKAKQYLHFQNGIGSLEKKLERCKDAEHPKAVGNCARFLACTMNGDEGEAPNFQAIIGQLKRRGERLLEENHSDDNRLTRIVDQVISIIEEKYMDDISLGQIAAELDMTQNYLSFLFHKQTGTTFMKYLTRIRMLKAKELLSGSDMQVQQVANKVGYYSTRYFSKLFREAAGCQPSEYRKRFEKVN